MERKEKQKNKNRRGHLREHGLVLFGGKKPLCSLNIGVIGYAFFSFKQALEG